MSKDTENKKSPAPRVQVLVKTRIGAAKVEAGIYEKPNAAMLAAARDKSNRHVRMLEE